MISKPPTIEIQEGMGGCFLLNMLLLNFSLLIDVTFSTPTPVINNYLCGFIPHVLRHFSMTVATKESASPVPAVRLWQ
jgi:hypothetical protein